MKKSNRNIQRDGFRIFNQIIQNGETLPYQKEMHDAAIRCLKFDTNADAAEQAILSVGQVEGGGDVGGARNAVNGSQQAAIAVTQVTEYGAANALAGS